MQLVPFKEMMQERFPFNLLSDKELAMMLEDAELITFSKNEYIFHEDENEIDIFFLVSGLAKNILHRSSGKQFSVRFYYPGELVGLMILLTSGEMTFSVEALETSKAIRFNKVRFLEVMSGNQEFSKVVLEGIGDRMKSLYDEITNRSSFDDDENIDLFRTRVSNLMTPPVFIHPEDSMEKAAKLMKEHQATGLLVREESRLTGCIGREQMLDFLINSRPESKVKDWMDRSPHIVHDDSFAYEALSFFKYASADVIPVIRQGRAVGILSAQSFLGIRDSEYLELSYKVANSDTLEELIALSPKTNEKFRSFVSDLIEQDTFGYEVCEIISNFNDKIHRQIIKQTEAEMNKEGFGLPPVNYCFLVMGSEGRKEQAFSTDQDNGLIISDYEHLDNSEAIAHYFQRFAEKINHKLEACGYPLCTGGIMAKNAKWRHSLQGWKKEVERWINETDAEEIRDFTIFLDFRPIYGDFSLGEHLRTFMTEKVERSKTLQQLLMKDTIRFRVPLSPFGRIAVQSKTRTIDLKKAAIMQLVNGIRIYAIKYGVSEVNTLKRMKALIKLEAFHPRDGENAKMALHHLLRFRLQENLKQLNGGADLSNKIIPAEMPKDDQKKLKEALQVAKRMQQVTELSFNRNRVM